MRPGAPAGLSRAGPGWDRLRTQRGATAYPSAARDQVQLPHVSGIFELASAKLRQVEIAENVEAVIDADHHDVAAFAQPDSVGTG